MNDSEIMATVIHQFGHALGLGHALMKSEHWNTFKSYVHLRTMMSDCGASNGGDLEDQWTGNKQKSSNVNYDEDSIMKHRYELYKSPSVIALHVSINCLVFIQYS